MFAVAADAYDRFMGRFSAPLAPQFAEFADVRDGMRVLDVGCGPGALTVELVARLGPSGVTAVDPSEQFAAAARDRHPGVDVRVCVAERLPFDNGEFDVALAQLVVHFMADPLAGILEMRRVTRQGSIVAACVWDHAGGTGALSPFWTAARELDPDVTDESDLAGSREGHLGELFRQAGLVDVDETALSVSVDYPSFEAWWEPYTLGVGTAGTYLGQLDPERQADVRERCRNRLGDGEVTIAARAWAARGRV